METPRALATLAATVILLVSATTAGAVPAQPGPGLAADVGGTDSVRDASETDPVANVAPDDPENDTLGWESVNGTGLWYNESISVDRSDGLNSTELDKVVARGMARVEQIRKLEFERSVPVEVISREQFREESASRFENTSEKNRLHQNVKWEAMLMVGENTNSLAVSQQNRGAGVGGYYSPSEERIVIVSENTESPEMDEVTLSQELFHALQDQQYNISSFDQSTEELHNAKDGIIEGDGNYVDSLYRERCNAGWDCLLPTGGGSGLSLDEIHLGMYQFSLQPYSDGPAWVHRVYQDGGWEAVNELYENPPASTEQTIHPAKYDEDAPANVTFTDRSNENWRVLDLPNGSHNYATFGEGGLYMMLWYPSWAEAPKNSQGQPTARTDVVMPLTNHFGGPNSRYLLNDHDLYNYNHSMSAGWDGDELYPYVTDDSAETNETGYVWKVVWDSERDATEFLDGYQSLLEYNGADPVEGRENTFRIDDGNFSDAFYVQQEGDTLYLVNAPSVSGLSDVREGAAPQVSTETPTEDPTETTTEPTETTMEPTETKEPTTQAQPTDTEGGTTSSSGGQPGFGVAATVVALLAGLLIAIRRRQ